MLVCVLCSYGKVYKALKGGVQEVAVKCMHRMDEPLQDQFIQVRTPLCVAV